MIATGPRDQVQRRRSPRLPLRLTVARRGLAQNAVEFKLRTADARELVPRPDAVSVAKQQIAAMEAAIRATVTEVPFRSN